MLTQTSESAIRVLMFLALKGQDAPVSPRQIAESLRESPTYTSKITALLVRAGILRAIRGAHGGVVLNREPASISMLAVIEACQGPFLSSYCGDVREAAGQCAYHLANQELLDAVAGVLTRWTLAELIRQPAGASRAPGKAPCRMCALEPFIRGTDHV